MCKDYDISILYHLGKVNVIADALNCKAMSLASLACLSIYQRPWALEIQSIANFMVCLDISNNMRILDTVELRSLLFEQICDCQFEDDQVRYLLH